jgi:hypothetical protein
MNRVHWTLLVLSVVLGVALGVGMRSASQSGAWLIGTLALISVVVALAQQTLP